MVLVKHEAGIALWHDGDGGYRVTGYDARRDQVTSVLARDCPRNGGQWCARATERGVRYVTTGSLARVTALRHYRRILRDGCWE